MRYLSTNSQLILFLWPDAGENDGAGHDRVRD